MSRHRRGAITFNAARLNELKVALDNARSDPFTVEITGQGKHSFSFADARRVVREIGEMLAASPDKPRLPYNEGEEGQ